MATEEPTTATATVLQEVVEPVEPPAEPESLDEPIADEIPFDKSLRHLKKDVIDDAFEEFVSMDLPPLEDLSTHELDCGPQVCQGP